MECNRDILEISYRDLMGYTTNKSLGQCLKTQELATNPWRYISIRQASDWDNLGWKSWGKEKNKLN